MPQVRRSCFTRPVQHKRLTIVASVRGGAAQRQYRRTTIKRRGGLCFPFNATIAPSLFLFPSRSFRFSAQKTAYSFIPRPCPARFDPRRFLSFPPSTPSVPPTFSLVRSLQHPLFHSLRPASLFSRRPQPRSLLLSRSRRVLSSMPFVSMQPPSVRDDSAGHGEPERRARTAMFTRFRWRFFVELNAFLSVHAAILIMPAAGRRASTCAP